MHDEDNPLFWDEFITFTFLDRIIQFPFLKQVPKYFHMNMRWFHSDTKCKIFILDFNIELYYSFHNVFRISNFFGLSTTDETQVVEMRIWCIKTGIVLVLYCTSNIVHRINLNNSESIKSNELSRYILLYRFLGSNQITTLPVGIFNELGNLQEL
jgi:hypothetical protein